MTGWEIALLIVAFTYAMVNAVYMVMSVKFMTKMDRLFDRSLRICDQVFDAAEASLKED